jgi:hypothetical protein
MSVTVGLLVTLEALPGKETDVEEFLKAGRSLVEDEPATVAWFAVKLGPTTFAIVDFFPTTPAARPTYKARSDRRSGRGPTSSSRRRPTLRSST